MARRDLWKGAMLLTGHRFWCRAGGRQLLIIPSEIWRLAAGVFFMKKLLRKLIHRLGSPLIDDMELRLMNEAAAQKVLVQQYRQMAASGLAALPDLADVGFRKFSQFEEDGILLYLFSLVKPINRTCVEICAGNGRECNTANLIINHGWWGHLFDGSPENVNEGRAFYARNKSTFQYPPRFTQAWITAENVNELIAGSGASGPVDLLSLDIDGMDYWVWKAISVIDPQVVVCETHNAIPPDKALTVPYEPNFVYKSPYFRGASLAAMVKLGKEKGYRLIGTHRYGFNAFFMKNGVGEAYFPEVEPAACLQDPFSQQSCREGWPESSKFPWVEL